MIKNIKMNVKNTKVIKESYLRTEGLYNAQLTFINIANSK